MNKAAGGFRVAVTGASSLLGKELLAVLKERQFPISRLVTPGAPDDAEPDLPVLDLSGGLEAVVTEADVGESDLDFVFLAASFRPAGKKVAPENDATPFLGSSKRLASATRCKVIDMSESLAGEPGGVLSVPFLNRSAVSLKKPTADSAPRFFLSAHPATIVISTILLRLAARYPMKTVVAQVFGPVSEIGSQAIDELQKQTLNLLSFQKIPQAVFGTQLAFNLLPRFGRSRSPHIVNLESRLQKEIAGYLGGRVPSPALRVIYGPVFHSLACSLYVETVQPATIEVLTQALAGDPIRVRKASEPPPTQVEVAGSSEIIVDALTTDGGHSDGVWIWAAVDNLRLAAVNAVEIAESFKQEIRLQ
ncbi:MAG: Asd/ArgC dimerization domain-containing protein [Terriglobia bacterium]